MDDSSDLKAYDKFYSELKKWGRFNIVASRASADTLAVLTSSAEYSTSVGTASAVDVTTGNRHSRDRA